MQMQRCVCTIYSLRCAVYCRWVEREHMTFSRVASPSVWYVSLPIAVARICWLSTNFDLYLHAFAPHSAPHRKRTPIVLGETIYADAIRLAMLQARFRINTVSSAIIVQTHTHTQTHPP